MILVSLLKQPNNLQYYDGQALGDCLPHFVSSFLSKQSSNFTIDEGENCSKGSGVKQKLNSAKFIKLLFKKIYEEKYRTEINIPVGI